MDKNMQLNYEIIKKRTIMGQGDIETIKKKTLNRHFMLYSDKDEFFQIDLKFPSPSIITKIELKLKDTYKFSLRMMNSQKHFIQQFQKQTKNKEGRQTLFPQESEPITFVHLRIQNHPFLKKRLGITYVSFQGFSDQKIKKSTTRSSSFKNSVIEEVRLQSNLKKDPKSNQSKGLFNQRQKQKSVSSDVQRLLRLSPYDQIQGKQEESEQKLKKKVKRNESKDSSKKKSTKKQIDLRLQQKQETDLAIALSRSEQRRIGIQDENQKMQIQQKQKSFPEQLSNYMNNLMASYEKIYQSVEFNEDYIKLFSDLSPKWLESQRLAQIQASVKQQERISKYVRLKYLNGVQVYISGFPEWKIDQLQHQAKQLGCKVLQQLKNHCLAVVPKSQCQKLIKKHKSWNQIKYLRPQYLDDCINHKCKLSFKDYYLIV